MREIVEESFPDLLQRLLAAQATSAVSIETTQARPKTNARSPAKADMSGLRAVTPVRRS
jgi:hypothetical protein